MNCLFVFVQVQDPTIMQGCRCRTALVQYYMKGAKIVYSSTEHTIRGATFDKYRAGLGLECGEDGEIEGRREGVTRATATCLGVDLFNFFFAPCFVCGAH